MEKDKLLPWVSCLMWIRQHFNKIFHHSIFIFVVYRKHLQLLKTAFTKFPPIHWLTASQRFSDDCKHKSLFIKCLKNHRTQKENGLTAATALGLDFSYYVKVIFLFLAQLTHWKMQIIFDSTASIFTPFS